MGKIHDAVKFLGQEYAPDFIDIIKMGKIEDIYFGENVLIMIFDKSDGHFLGKHRLGLGSQEESMDVMVDAIRPDAYLPLRARPYLNGVRYVGYGAFDILGITAFRIKNSQNESIGCCH
jgi:hypothetical protein